MLVHIRLKKSLKVNRGEKIKIKDIADVVVSEIRIRKDLEEFALDIDTSCQGIKTIYVCDLMGKLIEKFPYHNFELIGEDIILAEVNDNCTDTLCFIINFALILFGVGVFLLLYYSNRTMPTFLATKIPTYPNQLIANTPLLTFTLLSYFLVKLGMLEKEYG